MAAVLIYPKHSCECTLMVMKSAFVLTVLPCQLLSWFWINYPIACYQYFVFLQVAWESHFIQLTKWASDVCMMSDQFPQPYIFVCRVGVCREAGQQGICTKGFPRPLQPRAGATLNDQGVWEYHRPREQDRWTVPYHPQMTLLWDAHICVLKVSDQQFSQYLLKYALKAEPAGRLNLDNPENAGAVGLSNSSDIVRRTFMAHVLSRPISLAEATLSLLNVKPIAIPTIKYVNTNTPYQR